MPGDSILPSWSLNLPSILLLLAAAFVYLRGWLRANGSTERLAAFLVGLLLVFLALESPLDTASRFFLWVHMTQHLLLITVAPLLLVLGNPLDILLRGLPVSFVKQGLAPFFRCRALRTFAHRLTSPPVSFFLFAASMIVWHLPRFYQLALDSPAWHDVQHACFFWSGALFWFPVFGRFSRKPRWFAIPYLLLADLLNTAFSAFLIFSGRVLYPAYESVRISAMSPATDQALAGAIMWVPGSIFFLGPAVVVAYGLIANRPRGRVRAPRSRRPVISISFDLRTVRHFGRPVMLAAALGIVVAGLAGSSWAASLTWFHWRAWSLLVLLAIGNLFCMSCPLTLARDIARKWITPRFIWPRWLRNKWLGAFLIVLYLQAYSAWSLWDRSVATAWIILGYFAAILAVDCLFTGAVFCKYVCPVGQFNFLVSGISPREIGVRDRAVCGSCRTHDCSRGNSTSRGCELALFQPTKIGNLDCTFCLDCVTACPSSNVALVPLPRLVTLTNEAPASGIGTLARRTDMAALAAVVTIGAFVNAASMLDLTPLVRSAWTAGLLIAMSLCFAGNAAVIAVERAIPLARRCILAMVPIGVSMWAAHLLYHAAPPALSPTSLHQLQIALLGGGVLMSIAALWRVAKRLALVAPWAMLSLLLYAAGVWIVFQPMQMAGMSM